MKKMYLLAASLIAVTAIGCSQPQTTNSNATAAEATAPKGDAGEHAGIVYINSDSLIAGYKMYDDMRAEFQIHVDKVDKELNSKGASFQKQVTEFENKVRKGLITNMDAQSEQQRLENERLTLLQYRETKMKELQEKEMVMTNNISENVKTYIAKYNETKKYKMILNTSAATNTVMAADSTLDITREVLEGLNAEYTPKAKESKK